MSALQDLQTAVSKLASDSQALATAVNALVAQDKQKSTDLAAANSDLAQLPSLTTQVGSMDASMNALSATVQAVLPAPAPAPSPAPVSAMPTNPYHYRMAGDCPKADAMKAVPGLSLMFDTLMKIITNPAVLAIERQIAIELWKQLQDKVNTILAT